MPAKSRSGAEIALELILNEASRQTGTLDLGRLGLTELPDELFSLTHLRVLNLGSGYAATATKWKQSENHRGHNQIGKALGRLSDLPALRSISVRDTDFEDVDCLMPLRHLVCMDLSGSHVASLGKLHRLFNVEWMSVSRTGIRDISAIADLALLKRFHCRETFVKDVSVLSGLNRLDTINVSRSSIDDLGPLRSLRSLRRLNIGMTKVSDLTPITSERLQTLNIFGTPVSYVDVSPFSKALQSFNCSWSGIGDLGMLTSTTSLKVLRTAHTSIHDLEPLSALDSLEVLDLERTGVRDLTPLSNLKKLRRLNISETAVENLTPLSSVSSLKSLACSWTRVRRLDALGPPLRLEELECNECDLNKTPIALFSQDSLRRCYLFQTSIPRFPPELLSRTRKADCAEAVRAHVLDLRGRGRTSLDVKLVVLGNGRVGKTQICRRICGEDYDDSVESTHGIHIRSKTIEWPGQKPVRLHIWDFGGQELYHGTHTLFLKTSAAFMVVWSKSGEAEPEHTYQGVQYRNLPLGYWCNFVTQLAEQNSKVIVVQNQCDLPRDGLARPRALEDLSKTGWRFATVRYSAKRNRNRRSLDLALKKAVLATLPPSGPPTIGPVRLRVRRELERMRERDSKRPREKRQHRTLSREQFDEICDRFGGVASTEAFLTYLHNVSAVYYRRGVFGDRVVIDQEWALDAVYSIFDRRHCYGLLKDLGGRFTLETMRVLVWSSHSIEECNLFLSMMREAGICFVHTRRTREEEAVYMAPELLPDRVAVSGEIEARWPSDGKILKGEFLYPLQHSGIMRNVTARVGSKAAAEAVYWKGGVCLYETTTKCRALIEEDLDAEGKSRILLSVQGPNAARLIVRLGELIMEESERVWLRPTIRPIDDVGLDDDDEASGATTIDGLAFGPAPREEKGKGEYYISYSRGDASTAGRAHEERIQILRREAAKSGLYLHRDREDIPAYDSIPDFMDRIKKGDRIFVIITNEYLRSDYAMAELHGIYTWNGRDSERFRQRIRTFIDPEVQIYKSEHRLECANHWRDRYDQLCRALTTNRDSVGPSDLEAFSAMQAFVRDVPDILSIIASRRQPESFEEYMKNAFAGLPRPQGTRTSNGEGRAIPSIGR